MSMQVKLKEALTRVNDRICPTIRKNLEEARIESLNCRAKAALYQKFEVHHYENKYSVSLRTCTCRDWELSGIPCLHAIAACSFMGEDPVVYVHDYYSVEKCMQAYEHGLEPLNGKNMWPEVSGFTVKPPRVRKMPGRPKKKRIRSDGEPNPRNRTKMSQRGMLMTCSNCKGTNNNSKTCSKPKVVHPPAQKRKRGSRAKGIHVSRGRSGGAIGTVARGGVTGRVGSGTNSVAAQIAREMNIAMGEAGVFVSETRNMYYHVPVSNVVRHVHRARENNDGALTSASTKDQMENSTREYKCISTWTFNISRKRT